MLNINQISSLIVIKSHKMSKKVILMKIYLIEDKINIETCSTARI